MQRTFSGTVVRQPSEVGVHRVVRNDLLLHGLTSRAFKPAVLEAHGTRAYARKHHAQRAAQTARALDRCAAGKIIKHDAYLIVGTSLSVTDGCQWSVMERALRNTWPAAGQNCSDLENLGSH